MIEQTFKSYKDFFDNIVKKSEEGYIFFNADVPPYHFGCIGERDANENDIIQYLITFIDARKSLIEFDDLQRQIIEDSFKTPLGRIKLLESAVQAGKNRSIKNV